MPDKNNYILICYRMIKCAKLKKKMEKSILLVTLFVPHSLGNNLTATRDQYLSHIFF